jgi:hypothetical protein
MTRHLIGKAIFAAAALALCACGQEMGGAVAQDMPDAARQAPIEMKSAMCIVGVEFKDECLFDPHGRGSFSLRKEDGRPLYDDIVEVSVFVFAEGQADVRTKDGKGVSTRLGEALRSEEYPACWLGDGFSVCAY